MMQGRAFWPGVRGVISCEYTVSRGIAPSVASMTIRPQPASEIQMTGDLIMTDGERTLTIPRCKVDGNRNSRSDRGGTVTTLYLLDRRWRWRDLGGMQGIYNQIDPAGIVRPYMRQTPYELAELCLRALGEVNYTIVLPNVTVLPPVAWHYLPPAQALEALVTSLGCCVNYRLDTDTILIAPIGMGADLPPGHTSDESLALDTPERPDRVYVIGQPFRYQSRFLLTPKIKEWNGEAVAPREVSYRPAVNPTTHRVKVTPASPTMGNTYTVILNDVEFKMEVGAIASVAAVIAGLKAAIDAQPQLPYGAVDEGTFLTIFGAADGTPFDCVVGADTNGGGGDPTIRWELVAQGVNIDADPWAQSPVHTFANVRGTDRLTKSRAIAYARESLYRWYELTIDDPTGVNPTVQIPDFTGVLKRKEQIVLHQNKAEQIEPVEIIEPVGPDGKPRLLLDAQGRPKKELFYDGHARDKPATVYGSYFIGTVGRINTEETSEVTVDFSIDPVRQLVIFAQPVFFQGNGFLRAASLTLEVAHNIRDSVTHDFLCVEGWRDFPPPLFGTQPLYVIREDIQASVIGLYDDTHHLIGVDRKGLAEAKQKADYYLQAIMSQYEVKATQSRTYAGLQGIWLDGAISQVTWRVGGGSKTQASRNSEHSRVIPPHPQRQRNGVLDAVVRRKGGANPPFQGIADDPGAGGMVPIHMPPTSQNAVGFWGGLSQ